MTGVGKPGIVRSVVRTVLYAMVRFMAGAAQKRAKLLAEVGLPRPEHKDEENEKKLLGLHEVRGLKLKPVAEEPLDEETTQSIEALLFTFPMNIRLSVALSLYMGLNASELCALRYSDIDIEKSA